MPSLVDSHVHVNQPGRTEWEGFESATKAAVAGGVCLIGDMPLNSSPVVTSAAAYRQKYNEARNLWTDVVLLGGVVPENVRNGELEKMINEGVTVFKCFMTHSGLDEFPNVNEEEIELAYKAFRNSGKEVVFMFHAEDEHTLKEASNPHLHEPKHSYKRFLASRPAEAENAAIKVVIDLCRKYRVRSHIVHLSSASAIPLIAQAKREGVPISAETTFHYLYFDAETVPEGNTLYKCCPPIREASNNEALWKEGLLTSKAIELIVSDHSPCTPGTLSI